MTYNVFSETLNPTQSIKTQQIFRPDTEETTPNTIKANTARRNGISYNR